MREALRLLHEQVRSANEELPEFVEQAFLEMDERKKIHILKVLRVLAYRKMACVEWIRRIEWAKPFRASGNEPEPAHTPPIKYMVLLAMSDGVFDTYERTQHELLAIVTEREKTYEGQKQIQTKATIH